MLKCCKKLVDTFKTLDANISIKLHYLHRHLDRFLENLGTMSNEQGERFHQDINKWYADTKVDGMKLANCYWSLERDDPDAEYL